MVDFDQKVVVVDLLALERVARGTLDGVGMSRASSTYEISDAAMFVALIVVYVP
jgi:hypothetical protein